MKKIKNNRCGYQKHWVSVPGKKGGGFCRRNPKAPASFAQESHVPSIHSDLLKAIGISAGTLTIAGVGFGAAMLLTRQGREKAIADANMSAVHEATAKVTAEYESKFKDLADRHQKDLETASKAPVPTTPPPTTVSPVDEAKTAELEKSLTAARTAHEELSKQHDRLKEEAASLKKTLAKAEADHEKTRLELDKSTSALTNHQKEIEFLRSKAGESEDLQKRLEVVQSDRDALAEAVAQHGRDLQSSAETIETLNQDLEQHKSTIAGLTAERETLTEQIKKHEETIAKARTHVEGLNRTLQGHRATIEGQGKMIIEKTAERDANAKKAAALQDKLNKSKAKYEELTQNFEQRLSERESKIKKQYESQRNVMMIEQENAIQDEIERLQKQKTVEIAQIRAEAKKSIANAERYSAVQHGKDTGLLIDHTPSGSVKTNGGIQFAASVRKNRYPISAIDTDVFAEHVKSKTEKLIGDLSDQVFSGTGSYSGSKNVPSINMALISHLKKTDRLTLKMANTAFSQTEERERMLGETIKIVSRKAIEDSVDAAIRFHESYTVTTDESKREKLIDQLDKVFRQVYQRSRKQIYDSHVKIMGNGRYSLRGILDDYGDLVTQPALGAGAPKRIQSDSYMLKYLFSLK